jgi:hypothetical protein
MSFLYPQILKRFGPKMQETFSEGILRDLFFDVLMVKGCHINLLGNPGSGKTQKQYWLVDLMSKIETIVWIDSCKDDEIAPLFSLGLHINIIIPKGVTIEIEHLLCPQGITISEASTPEAMWFLIRKDAINILSIENYFIAPRLKSKYYARLFKQLSYMAFHKMFKKAGMERITIVIDEAQKIVASTAYTRDQERIEAAMEVAANILENRGNGIRVITATQENSNLLPSARKNMPARILCRGARVKSDESKTLSRLCEYAERYKPNQGLFVLPSGKYIPSWAPWAFPFYDKPEKASIEYIGNFVDAIEDEEEIHVENLGFFHDKVTEPRKKKIEPGFSLADLPRPEEFMEALEGGEV